MKRMFDKEEIVEIAKEEGGSITVDSELSSTSENPVQNKVIYEALADKQDSLPDTTGQTDKFLKVGSDGLEWASAGGSGNKYLIKYRCTIDSNKFIISFYIVSDKIENSSTEIFNALKTQGIGSSSSIRLYPEVRIRTESSTEVYIPINITIYPYSTSAFQAGGSYYTINIATKEITVNTVDTSEHITVNTSFSRECYMKLN